MMTLRNFKEMVKEGTIGVQYGMDNHPLAFVFGSLEISFAKVVKEGSVYRYTYLPDSKVEVNAVSGKYCTKIARNRLDKSFGFINPKEDNTKELEFINSKLNLQELEAVKFLVSNWNTVKFNQFCSDLATEFEKKQAE